MNLSPHYLINTHIMFDDNTQKGLLREFLLEGGDILDQIEYDLLKLETSPHDKELLHNIFRNMHTIKGNCRLMGYNRLEELAHSTESLLHLLREGEMIANSETGSLLLGVIDSVRSVLHIIEQNGEEGDPDFTIQLAKLDSLMADAEASNTLDDFFIRKKNKKSMETVDICLDDENSCASQGDSTSGIETVRLPIERLDYLMDMVGELGATFNQLKYSLTRNRETIQQVLEGMDQHIHNLQDEVLKYRLQPVSRVWDSYHRLVRDLALESGKKVFLQMRGEETEVDRNVLLSIKDLLGHLIRNAIDHGIETPEERISSGKPALGTVTLSAEQRHGQIYMEVSDDGKGLDVERIKSKALATGMSTMRQIEGMRKEEIFQFIMEPGFSTAEKVSKISGRGTGMDVVRSSVEKTGGTISIYSDPGKGTKFRIRIPQTMAIVPALLIRSGVEQFAIPQLNVTELLSFYGDDSKSNVEYKMQSPMVRVRERLLPLVLLDRVIEGEGKFSDENFSLLLKPKEERHIVILQSETGEFGLEVDRIEEPVSLVIKPMPGIFSHISILAGTAVMPDGAVSFLLNVSELGKIGIHSVM